MKALVARLLALLGALLVCAHASPAAAAVGAGGFGTANATPIASLSLTQTSFVTFTISTTNLSAGGDTVIHVQDSSGAFVAGNDDAGGTHASSVVIGPIAGSRTLTVLVRAYDSSSAGTATLVVKPSNAAQSTFPITFAGTLVGVAPAGLPAASHVFTGQNPGGAADTVLLVVNGAHAYGFDDDSGAENMSSMITPEACTTCLLAVGTFVQAGQGSGTTGSTTFYWDTGRADADGDRVGDGLEEALTTSDSNQDSDQDGISDLLEISGTDSSDAASLNYPKMGAKPKQPDLFIEADWIKCTGTGCSNVNQYQVTEANALAFASAYAPDIAVHIDTGVTNTSGQNLSTWGNWGGAAQDADESIVDCRGLSASRNSAKTFFHLLSNSWSSSTHLGGKCVIAKQADAGHETGHALFLDHGGASAAINANCKPNYKSKMNYTFDGRQPGFSRNSLGAFPLNPTSLDEDRPFGTTDVSFLSSYPFGFMVQGTHVDWNRDGVFAPAGTRVRAAPNAVLDTGNCSPLVDRQSFFPTFDTTEAAGTWLAVAPPETARFYLFTRRTSTGRVQYRSATLASMQSCSGLVQPNPGLASPCVTWSPAFNAEGTTVPNSLTQTSPAAARVGSSSGAERVLLVYVNNGLVTYQVDNIGLFSTDNWTSPSTIPGGLAPWGDPALIAAPDGSQVTLFFPSSGTLRSAVYTASTSQWSSPVTELWADGTAVAATLGVGLTWGFESTQSGRRMYAAIPFDGSQTGQIQFARRDPMTLRWTKVSFGEDSYTRTDYRPALAFVPFDKSVSLTAGRFYWAHDLPDDGKGRLAFTEGNDSAAGATARRMSNMAYRQFTTLQTRGGMSMFYDPVRDDNLRLAYTYGCSGCDAGQQWRMSFFPIADGIVNAQYADQDDYPIFKNNLRPALGLSPPAPIK